LLNDYASNKPNPLRVGPGASTVIDMQYFTQDIQLWVLAALGVTGVLSAVYYQILGWRWNSHSMDVSLLTLLLLAVTGCFVLPFYLPYPPFTWLQWVAENVPKECSAACWERELVFASAALTTGLAICGSLVLVFWGPWWLSPWSRQYREMSKLEESARLEADRFILDDAAPRAKILYLAKPRRSASHMLTALEEVLLVGNADEASTEYVAKFPYIADTGTASKTGARI
jgi:hypothetical protein